MAQKVRVAGGFTVFHWQNTVIAYADQVQVTSVAPVTDAVPVQPMNALRPLEIATPRAHGHGTIILTLTELYNQAVWQRLAGLTKSNDIIDIMEFMAQQNDVQITRYVEPPTGVGDTYQETYHNCAIVRATDDEAIRIDTMLLNKEIEVWYTYSKKSWIDAATRPATFS